MFADETLRCECGYEVRALDEAARVDEVRRHASEAHGVDLAAAIALDVVRRGAGESSTPESRAGGTAQADTRARPHAEGTTLDTRTS